MGKPSGITSRATRVLAVLLLLGILSSSLFHTAWAQEAKPDPTPTPSTSASAAPVSPSPNALGRINSIGFGDPSFTAVRRYL